MFGWRMEEEAKLEFTITVNWRREDGNIATTQLGTLEIRSWMSRVRLLFGAREEIGIEGLLMFENAED